MIPVPTETTAAKMPSPDSGSLIETLARRLDAGALVTESADMATFVDEPRGRWRQLPLAVVRPGDTAGVAAVIEACRGHGVAVVTRGGGTGTVGGASVTGARRELLLSLDRMRAIRSVSVEAATLTAEAGVTLAAASTEAGAHGLEVPLWLASGGTATLGGVLATNAGGNTTIRHGNARRMLLGLEAVLADGRVLDLPSGLRKDNSGYALGELLVGSEGTLGIITAATLGLVAQPRQRATLWCALASPAAALTLLARARDALGETLSAFELMPRRALELSLAHLPGARDPLERPSPWYVLLQADSAMAGDWLEPAATALVGAEIERGGVTDAVVATRQAQAASLWALREAISPAQKALGASIKHDISIPVAAIPAMIDEALAEISARIPGVRPCVFGHVGDGNLHFNLSRPADWSDAEFMAVETAVNRIVFDRVEALGGSIAAEHGIGQLRRAELERRLDPVRLDVMRSIKHALDPDGVLNPGKLVGQSRAL